MTPWAQQVASQWIDPAWRARNRGTIRGALITIACLAAFGWWVSRFLPSGGDGRSPLDRDEAAYFQGIGTDADAREQFMLSQGVRVVMPDVEIISNEDDEGHISQQDGPQYCPDAFPVIGTTYGVYYVNTDPMFAEFDRRSDKIALCFANESAARAAGYIHGPVNELPGR